LKAGLKKNAGGRLADSGHLYTSTPLHGPAGVCPGPRTTPPWCRALSGHGHRSGPRGSAKKTHARTPTARTETGGQVLSPGL